MSFRYLYMSRMRLHMALNVFLFSSSSASICLTSLGPMGFGGGSHFRMFAFCCSSFLFVQLGGDLEFCFFCFFHLLLRLFLRALELFVDARGHRVVCHGASLQVLQLFLQEHGQLLRVCVFVELQRVPRPRLVSQVVGAFRVARAGEDDADEGTLDSVVHALEVTDVFLGVDHVVCVHDVAVYVRLVVKCGEELTCSKRIPYLEVRVFHVLHAEFGSRLVDVRLSDLSLGEQIEYERLSSQLLSQEEYGFHWSGRR